LNTLDIHTVTLTVLMPVYNGERFLNKAIDSILNQSFSNFEFLIINDGSTDASERIIRSYIDPRIILINNEKNLGLVKTFNKGIALSKGKYIARMDCDDISLENRLNIQVDYLENHPEVSLIAGHIELINKEGNSIGYWPEDVQTKTGKEIKALLPYANCIAHPTVVIRTSIAKEYLYNPKQPLSEDWDLWLRMASDKKKIEKINTIVLQYRLHSESFTNINNQKNVYRKVARVQLIFFMSKLRKFKINFFDLKVLSGCIENTINIYTAGKFEKYKRSINKLFTIKIPKKINRIKSLINFYNDLKNNINNSGLFFFFPFYHIGGAERVHIDILKTISDKKPWVFITNQSENDAFSSEFSKYAKIFDISSFCGKYRWITKKIISNKINKTNYPVTFACNSHFYYNLIPSLNKKVRCTDLVHAFSDKGILAAEDWSLPRIDRLNNRIFISKRTIQDLKEQYAKNKVPLSYLNNIQYIPNQVYVPKAYEEKTHRDILNALYVGRGTNEKRVHLIAEIAMQCSLLNLPIKFELVGNVKSSINSKYYPYLNFTGEIKEADILLEKYKEADILLITSFREGFPMVVMEGMANGVVSLCTNVGDIPAHITNQLNGIIITSQQEPEIVTSFINEIKNLCSDRKKLSAISKKAYEYANINFSYEKFRLHYRELLLNGTPLAKS
jgi:glycosyltransferase involved in cell wall biosynthesis